MAIIDSCHGQAGFRNKTERTTTLTLINSKDVAGLPFPELSLSKQRDLLDEVE